MRGWWVSGILSVIAVAFSSFCEPRQETYGTVAVFIDLYGNR
jgi:hypothetical protein